MTEIKLKVVDAQGSTLCASPAGNRVSIVHTGVYGEGDRIVLECGETNGWCAVRFEDSMPETLLFITEREISFPIPFGEKRAGHSPKSFTGSCHLITARAAEEAEISARRNLAFNPYDCHQAAGYYPHASANVETRDEAVFAARNAIDGVFENSSHGNWPYQSWGINRDPNAALRLEFGRPVTIDEIRLTLRADFPHDNYWTQADVLFSDQSRETLPLIKTAEPQRFPLKKRTVEWLVLERLIRADGPSPFPALTQLEAWGTTQP